MQPGRITPSRPRGFDSDESLVNASPALPSASDRSVVRRVVLGQLLWTAGYTLTSGGFLLYFARELGAATGRDREVMGVVTAFLLAVPETVGVAGLWCRSLVAAWGRKRVYVTGTLVSRCVAFGMPLLAVPWLRPAGIDPLWLMIGLLAVAEGVQAVAYLAYLSWLSDLVPEQRWGRFFAVRNVAKLSILLVVPVAGGFLRDWWRNGLPDWLLRAWRLPADGPWSGGLSDDGSLLAYVVTFGLGTGLMLLSVVPMLGLSDVPVRLEDDRGRLRSTWQRVGEALGDRSLRFLLIHQSWLAAANGLTQAAFFGFLFREVHVGLGVFYLLASTMRLVKLPVSLVAGWWCDAGWSKGTLFWSLVVAAAAMPVWFVTTPETWWLLFAAYALWGSYAAANIAGRNLLLELSPRSDNTLPLGLFRQLAGLLAGLTGLAGGFWLDHLARTEFTLTLTDRPLGGYHLLFALSFVGRLTAVLWLLPVRSVSKPSDLLAPSGAER